LGRLVLKEQSALRGHKVFKETRESLALLELRLQLRDLQGRQERLVLQEPPQPLLGLLELLAQQGQTLQSQVRLELKVFKESKELLAQQVRREFKELRDQRVLKE
jgi:hypothetical protein